MAQRLLAPSQVATPRIPAYVSKPRKAPMSGRKLAGVVFANVAVCSSCVSDRLAGSTDVVDGWLAQFREADVPELRLAKQRIQEVQAVLGAKVKVAATEAPARRIHKDRTLMAAYITAAAAQQAHAAVPSA